MYERWLIQPQAEAKENNMDTLETTNAETKITIPSPNTFE